MLHIIEDTKMINQNYDKLMKMNLTKMAEASVNEIRFYPNIEIEKY